MRNKTLGFVALCTGPLLAAALLWLAMIVKTAELYAASAPSWQAEWEKAVAGAKKEGKVVVKGPPGAPVRRVLTGVFEKAYPGIAVEYEGGQGGELAAKLVREREASLYTTDVWIGGLGTQLSLLKPKEALDPIEQALILPEVKDPKHWREGKLEFADREGKYSLVFVNQAGSLLARNTQLVKSSDVPKSLQDLLDPKWKGKMIIIDPTTSGPGRAMFTWLFKEIGPDYIQALAKQKPTFTRDRRSLAEQVARGAYPLGVAVSNVDAQPFLEAKAPLDIIWEFKEGSYASASYGGLTLINKAPHPNAAKVYVNWLLGKEGQHLFAEAAGWVSRRLDVSPGDPEAVLKPGVKYFPIYLEEYTFVYRTPEYRKVIKEAFGLGR